MKRIFKIELDGALIEVCESCKSYGKLVRIEKISEPKNVVVKQKEDFEDEEIVENFGEVIREERERRKIPIQEFAKLLGIKESTLLKIESGKLLPEDKILERIERLLNVKLRERVKSQKVDEKKADRKLKIADIVEVK